jgi:hypothetical protein
MGGVPARALAEALVKEAITTTSYLCQGASMLFYPAALPLSARTLTYVAGVAGGFGIGTATAWRYVSVTVALLAARATA